MYNKGDRTVPHYFDIFFDSKPGRQCEETGPQAEQQSERNTEGSLKALTSRYLQRSQITGCDAVRTTQAQQASAGFLSTREALSASTYPLAKSAILGSGATLHIFNDRSRF